MSTSHHISTHPTFTISEVVVPDRLDSPDAADFIGLAEVRSVIEAELRGSDQGDSIDHSSAAAELLPNWKDETHPMWGLVAKVGGRVVGRGNLALPVGARECWGAVGVLPEFRGRGIGPALYEQLERQALHLGRTIIQTQIDFPAGVGGASVAAPTGFGTVPLALASTRFLQRYGFSLEQVGRLSRIPLPLDPGRLSSLLATATAAAQGYRTESWQGRTPDARLDDLALMRTRMSTDTPNAGIVQTEDVWTADRVRSVDDLWEESPRTVLTTIAIHEATGLPAGYTDLDVPPNLERPVDQLDTLVLADHRGHRLGMLLKLTNLLELAARFPGARSVETMNAEDNRPMLDVNEEVGFRPVSYSASWRKDLA